MTPAGRLCVLIGCGLALAATTWWWWGGRPARPTPGEAGVGPDAGGEPDPGTDTDEAMRMQDA